MRCTQSLMDCFESRDSRASAEVEAADNVYVGCYHTEVGRKEVIQMQLVGTNRLIGNDMIYPVQQRCISTGALGQAWSRSGVQSRLLADPPSPSPSPSPSLERSAPASPSAAAPHISSILGFTQRALHTTQQSQPAADHHRESERTPVIPPYEPPRCRRANVLHLRRRLPPASVKKLPSTRAVQKPARRLIRKEVLLELCECTDLF
jgi:hypothetical protein